MATLKELIHTVCFLQRDQHFQQDVIWWQNGAGIEPTSTGAIKFVAFQGNKARNRNIRDASV